LKELLNW